MMYENVYDCLKLDNSIYWMNFVLDEEVNKLIEYVINSSIDKNVYISDYLYNQNNLHIFQEKDMCVLSIAQIFDKVLKENFKRNKNIFIFLCDNDILEFSDGIKSIVDLYKNAMVAVNVFIKTESFYIPEFLKYKSKSLYNKCNFKLNLKYFLQKIFLKNNIILEDIDEIEIILKSLMDEDILRIIEKVILKKYSIVNKYILMKETSAILSDKYKIIIKYYDKTINELIGAEQLKIWLLKNSFLQKKLKFLKEKDIKKIVLLYKGGVIDYNLKKIFSGMLGLPIIRFNIDMLNNIDNTVEKLSKMGLFIFWVDVFGNITRSLEELLSKLEFFHIPLYIVINIEKDLNISNVEESVGDIDEIFCINLPNSLERLNILKKFLYENKLQLSERQIERLVSRTSNFSVNDIKKLMRIIYEEKLLKSKMSFTQIKKILKKVLNENRDEIRNDKKLKNFYEDNLVFVQGEGIYKEMPIGDMVVLKTQVTQEMYEKIMGNNPSKFMNENNPVEQISYIDALNYCNKLSELSGLKPVYDIVDDKIYVKYLDGNKIEIENANFLKTEGYRLPTEEEWIWIVKGGRKNKMYQFFYGIKDQSYDINNFAWYRDNTSKVRQVATKNCNKLGIFDLFGNVWEWTVFVKKKGYARVCGGCWYSKREQLNVEYINLHKYETKSCYIGFRVLRTIY